MHFLSEIYFIPVSCLSAVQSFVNIQQTCRNLTMLNLASKLKTASLTATSSPYHNLSSAISAETFYVKLQNNTYQVCGVRREGSSVFRHN